MPLIITLLAGLFILLGAVAIKFSKETHKVEVISFALALGALVSLMAFDLIPDMFEGEIKWYLVLIFVAVGFGFLFVLDLLAPDHEDHHDTDENHDEENSAHIGIMSALAVILHNIVEGMTDLGCTETIVQNYMANIAVNSNYFYAVSTINSTNYMVIANKKQKITQDSRKLWFGAPWDYDDGNVGYLFNCSPSVIYWETVLKNRRNNQEFAAAFGQNHGTVSFVALAKEFKKSERQLLLTKKINTIYHDVYNELYYWNDNVVNQTEDNVLKEECNVRLEIRISKAMPVLLNQFKGYQHSPKTRALVCDVINYWFKTTVMGYGTTIQDWQVV